MTEPSDLDRERRKRDTSEGFREDLNSALNVMIHVIRGQQTVLGMAQWIADNYPDMRARIPKNLRDKLRKD